METTFYEDSRYRGAREVGMKRPATLDLDAVRSGKKARGANSLLTSPDMHMLKLESPELEKLIIQQHGLVGSTHGQCMYPTKGDEDSQQHYARDFADALGGLPHSSTNNMHLYQTQQQNPHGGLQQPETNMILPPSSLPPVSMSMSMVDTYGYQQPLSSININCNPMVSSAMSCYAPVGSGGYYGMEALSVSVKEEPQTVPCAGPSPPQSPIDMEDQERMKLERKRLRNRIAASKCRRRKLERIARLEDKVAHLKSENSELTGHVTRLREHVCALKQQVMDHVRSGCEILVSNFPNYGEDL